MREVADIVQLATAANGPQQELAARARASVVQRYREAMVELERPLVSKMREIEDGAATQQTHLANLKQQVAAAHRSTAAARTAISAPIEDLQRAAERIDQRVRVLETVRRQL